MFLLKGRVTERTEQKTIKRKEDKEMSKLDTVQRELCRKLGDEYRIMRIDYEKVIYRDFGNGFNVEISGTHTTKS